MLGRMCQYGQPARKNGSLDRFADTVPNCSGFSVGEEMGQTLMVLHGTQGKWSKKKILIGMIFF